MNPSHRDIWPPLSGQGRMHRLNEQQHPRPGQPGGFGPNTQGHQQASQSGSVLPPPPPASAQGPFYSTAAPNGPNLPTMTGMTQPSPGMSNSRPSMAQPQQNLGPQGHNMPPQSAGFPLPGINQGPVGQTLPPQQVFEREREMQEAREREAREREYDHISRRERDARDREMRDRQQREQGQHEAHQEQILLHQPVAVGPQMGRAIHGPNGLLANGGPQSSGIPTPGPSNGQVNLFAPHYDGPRGVVQPAQAPMQNIPPFNGNGPNGHPIPLPTVAQGQQPILNDALSYLDQVKVQFHGEPNVYNQFLDIMKDFKSQAIDTPGVIRRVSSLFAGNPNLIQGFNTFLPPGYRIECGTADDPNAIRVTTPMGTTVSPMGSALRPLSPRPAPVQQIEPGPQENRSFDDGQNQNEWHHRSGDRNDMFSPGSRNQALPMYGHQLAQVQNERSSPFEASSHQGSHAGVNIFLLQHQQEQRGVAHLHNAIQVATGEPMGRQESGMLSPMAEPASLAAGLNGAQQGSANGDKRGPVEFNHAISYVNKIKNRFAQQPEIYKQFLEILQTYQRESKPIQDVYAQVTHLFNGAPDLLEDFKQFLPESAAHAKAAAAKQAAEDATMLSSIRGDNYGQSTQQHTPRTEQHRLPPVGNFAPTPSAGRDTKRKRHERHGNTQGAPPINSAVAGVDQVGSSSKNGFATGKRARQASTQQPPVKVIPQVDAPPVSPTLVPALPEPMPPSTTAAASSEELAFFDRVKKFIGNKNTMTEFLKLCNLYSQDLIDKNLLVFRVQNFIGANPELFTWFKNFVGHDGKDDIVENRARPVSGRVTLNNCRGLGPSYRYLPKRERSKICSGRDELCNSVLNDEWASHPTWASEDSGFIAHRKNIHEEGLHRIEEERHDYDLHIAMIERSIQILEPLAQQNRIMSEQERQTWQLPPDFGGPIHRKVIAKIYSRPKVDGVMRGQAAEPANVVPVMLLRLRQFAEQWKAAQREWEKVWRDQTQKMFWKSLDHQGISAKQADKRQFQAKTLQNEIQVKFEEQKRQRLNSFHVVPKHQAEYVFQDMEVLMDASHLLLTYAEQGHSSDFPRLTTFIRDFVPQFFGLDQEAFRQRIREVFDSPPNEEVDEGTTADESAVPRGRKMNGRRADLLRDVLERGRGSQPKDDGIASRSRASTPGAGDATVDEEMSVSDETVENTWLNHPIEGNIRHQQNVKPNEPYKRTVYNLYANLPIYCFFRMFVILYERLYNLKLNEGGVHETVRRAKAKKAAIELKIVDKVPSDYFKDTSSSANYYNQMLVMLEDLVRGEGNMDMAHLEEVLRRYYLHSGWMLYSFDKLLSALVRFAIAILGNDGKEKSWDILQLFQKDRKKEMTIHQDELAYRRQVEKYVKDGDVYRISYNESSRMSTIRILKRADVTFDIPAQDGVYTPEQRWAYYISSYTTFAPTEGVPYADIDAPFLKRSVRAVQKETVIPILRPGAGVDDSNGGATDVLLSNPASRTDLSRLDHMRSKEGLGLRISPDTYRIHWTVAESTEWWITASASTASITVNKSPSAAAQATTTGTTGSTAANAVATTELATVVHDGGAAGAAATTDAPPVAEATQSAAASATKDEEGKSTAAAVVSDSHEEQGQDQDGYGDRAGEFEGKFVMNNRWMAGLARDEVEARKGEFRKWAGLKNGGDDGLAGAEKDDVVMED